MYKKHTATAKALHTTFQQNHEQMDLSFFYTYPLNCCQGASIILTYLFLDIHLNTEINIVKDPSRKNEHHYYHWLEVDKKLLI